jgi:hypothetical protein
MDTLETYHSTLYNLLSFLPSVGCSTSCLSLHTIFMVKRRVTTSRVHTAQARSCYPSPFSHRSIPIGVVTISPLKLVWLPLPFVPTASARARTPQLFSALYHPIWLPKCSRRRPSARHAHGRSSARHQRKRTLRPVTRLHLSTRSAAAAIDRQLNRSKLRGTTARMRCSGRLAVSRASLSEWTTSLPHLIGYTCIYLHCMSLITEFGVYSKFSTRTTNLLVSSVRRVLILYFRGSKNILLSHAHKRQQC